MPHYNELQVSTAQSDLLYNFSYDFIAAFFEAYFVKV